MKSLLTFSVSSLPAIFVSTIGLLLGLPGLSRLPGLSGFPGLSGLTGLPLLLGSVLGSLGLVPGLPLGPVLPVPSLFAPVVLPLHLDSLDVQLLAKLGYKLLSEPSLEHVLSLCIDGDLIKLNLGLFGDPVQSSLSLLLLHLEGDALHGASLDSLDQVSSEPGNLVAQFLGGHLGDFGQDSFIDVEVVGEFLVVPFEEDLGCTLDGLGSDSAHYWLIINRLQYQIDIPAALGSRLASILPTARSVHLPQLQPKLLIPCKITQSEMTSIQYFQLRNRWCSKSAAKLTGSPRGDRCMYIREHNKQVYNNYIEMDYETQMYLQSCENYLRSPDAIEPGELAQYMASYSHLGLNDFITSLVQRYFYANLNHPELFRYIHLLDRLIKLAFPLPASFVRMFTECYRQAIANGRKSIQEELKILRKIWTPVLTHQLIHQLRIQVYYALGVDLEQDLREESRKFLQNYFEKNMMLHPHIIHQILEPQSKIAPLPQPNLLKPLNNRPSPSREMGLQPHKRVKMNEDTEPQTRPEKIPKKPPTKQQKALQLLNNLRNSFALSCKQCGQYFQTNQALQTHKKHHFQHRMQKYQTERANQTMKKMKITRRQVHRQLNAGEWSGLLQFEQALAESTVVMAVGEQLGHRHCAMCGCKFNINITDDRFVYEGAIRVKLEDRAAGTDIMHSQCYKILITTSSQ